MTFKKEEGSSMKELMVIKNDDSVLIDARLLHLKLNSGYRFNDWINSRIIDFGFKENEDFYKIFSKSTGGRKAVEYHLTMDMAKELAMLERNEIGRSIRRYFIKAEKEARAKQLPVAFDLPKDLKVIDLNGRKLLPYHEFLAGIGHKPGGGAYARKRRYPNHFIKFNGMDHVTVEMAQLIGMNWLIIEKRKQVKTMQPVLPLEFGAPLQLKGGQA